MVHISVRPSSSLISSLVLVVLLLFVVSSYSKKTVKIAVICKETLNSTYCKALLNSKRGASDLVSLAKFCIDVVDVNVTNTISLIKTLMEQSGSDPKARQHYQQCLDSYASSYVEPGAAYYVEVAREFLKAKDYHGLNHAGSNIIIKVDDCIGENRPPIQPHAADPSLLKKYGDLVLDVSSIILVISNMLLN